MYIVAIGWIYVVFMMSITEDSVVAGLMTFFLYGILPLSIILYLTGMQRRRRHRDFLRKRTLTSDGAVVAGSGEKQEMEKGRPVPTVRNPNVGNDSSKT